MKKFIVLAAILAALTVAISGCGDYPPTVHTKATLLQGTVVVTFTNPDMAHRYLTLVFNEPGTYTETFALGPSEKGAAGSRDKTFIPKIRTFTATTTVKEDDVYQTDWPTYFSVTVTDPYGTSDTVELYSN